MSDNKDKTFTEKSVDFANENPTLTGAAAGAVIGSVVPVVGTLSGAVVGAIIGHLHGKDKK